MSHEFRQHIQLQRISSATQAELRLTLHQSVHFAQSRNSETFNVQTLQVSLGMLTDAETTVEWRFITVGVGEHDNMM